MNLKFVRRVSERSPRGSTATLTMLWRNSWSITGQTHESDVNLLNVFHCSRPGCTLADLCEFHSVKFAVFQGCYRQRSLLVLYTERFNVNGGRCKQRNFWSDLIYKQSCLSECLNFTTVFIFDGYNVSRLSYSINICCPDDKQAFNDTDEKTQAERKTNRCGTFDSRAANNKLHIYKKTNFLGKNHFLTTRSCLSKTYHKTEPWQYVATVTRGKTTTLILFFLIE